MTTVHRLRFFPLVRLGGVLASVVLACGGCEKEEPIAFYQAPKEPTPVLATQPAGGGGTGAPAKADAAAGTLHWDVPDGWKESPAKPGQMRFATFVLADGPPLVELTVIPLGPEAGELLPNI